MTKLWVQPVLWENWSMDGAARPGGGFAAVLLTPGARRATGTVLLVTCEQLDCPQPTVCPVLDVPLPDGWPGGGHVAVAADSHSGNPALGYVDPTNGSLWLAVDAGGDGQVGPDLPLPRQQHPARRRCRQTLHMGRS